MTRRHHYLAIGAFLLSWALALTGGLLFAHTEKVGIGSGLYWAIGVVTTSGGDLVPRTTAGYWVAGLTKLLAIPMWSLSFALAMSWLTSLHIGDAAKDIKGHVSEVHDASS